MSAPDPANEGLPRLPAATVVSDLVKSYRPNRPNAVDDISFEVPPGVVFGLLGPNGAGKTTTVKVILGLVLPTRGTVRLAGYEMPRWQHKALRHAGAVLEGARNIYWRLSARANLEYFGALRGLRGKSLALRTQETLDLVGLADRADEETRLLSRGMQQKVALAVAVLHDPDVLLLDEPTLGLDVHAARAIESVIRKLTEEQRKAVLLTTHQMALAQRLCHRILVVNEGRKVVEGATDEVIQQFGGHHRTTEIRLAGAVDHGTLARLCEAFPFASVTTETETTTLSWSDTHPQQKLLELLNLVDGEGLSILHAGQREATLEEVFVHLTAGRGSPA